MHPTENPENLANPPLLPASNLNLTVHISRSELNNTLNYLVNTLFNEGFNVDEGYQIHTAVSGLVDMQTLNNQIITTLPLEVEIAPDGFFKNNKVKGIISVQLTTQLEIFQNQLLNKTDLTSYQWITKPKINILGLNIPIEPIANIIIKKYKSSICETIDTSIRKNFDLNAIKKTAQQFFVKPLYSTPDNIIHVYASPLEMALGPMAMTPSDLRIPVIFYFESVIAESKPQDLFNDLSFSIRPFFDTSSTFMVQSRLPLPYIEQILREQIENQKYGSGLTSITVHKMGMTGIQKKLSIQLEVTGAYNGNMELSFDPIYNKDKKKIQLENFKLKTPGGGNIKNIIFSLMKGFAENKLQKIIEEQINANLDDYLTNIQKVLSGTEVSTGIFLNGQLLEYEIKDIRFFNNRMYFNIASKLIMHADVRHIDNSKLIFNKL
jgi:hypothetical protein